MVNLNEVIILGFCSNKGENNARLNTLLHNGKEIGNTLWLKEEDVTFKDPSIFKKKWLQHGYTTQTKLKSNMNQINVRSRTCLDKSDTLFNFKPIINVHEIYTKHNCKITNLNLACAFSDLWNKVNVSAAKILFT